MRPGPISDGDGMSADGLTIRETPLDRESDALNFLFRDQAPSERRRSADDLIEQVSDGRAIVEFLLAATIDGELLGVQICVRHGRSTCFVWPPVVNRRVGTCEQVADALLLEANRRLERSNVSMAQVMSEVDDERSADRLQRNGFDFLTELAFLQRSPKDDVPVANPRLTTETYTSDNHDRFIRILEATYVGSLDCVGIDRKRSAADVLEGHRECGVHRPERWFLFLEDGVDVGVVLLTEHADRNTWEVVYVGVHHEHRGKAYGREMLAFGLRRARMAGCESVILAVDSANEPALRVYESLGFASMARRSVHVWFPSAMR